MDEADEYVVSSGWWTKWVVITSSSKNHKSMVQKGTRSKRSRYIREYGVRG